MEINELPSPSDKEIKEWATEAPLIIIPVGFMECPFCGGTHIRAQFTSITCYCECIDCYARGPYVRRKSLKSIEDDKEKAALKWNGRYFRLPGIEGSE